MTTFYRDIQRAENDLDNLKRAYLKRWGWRETCNTPGSFWLWQRDFSDVDARNSKWWEAACSRAAARNMPSPSKPAPYGVITADLDMAIKMTTRELDEFDEDREGDA
ncbi:hypothetical protein [Martelella sp. FOR1707]